MPIFTTPRAPYAISATSFTNTSTTRAPIPSTGTSGDDPAFKLISDRLVPRTSKQPLRNSDKYFFRLRMYDYSRPIPNYGGTYLNSDGRQQPEQVKYELIMPLPLSLYDNVSVRYGEEELGLMGDLANILGTPEQSFARLRDAMTDTNRLTELAREVGVPTVNRLVFEMVPRFVENLGSFLPGGIGSVRGMLQQAFGAAVNPNQALVMGGPNLRMFGFRWIIIPHDEQESINIQQTIRELRARSLPFIARGPSANGQGTSGLLGYPQICKINFHPWDNSGTPINNIFDWTDNSIIKIKRTMLTDVSASYNSQGTPAFFRGTTNYPVSIELNLTFKEVEYFLAEDEAPQTTYEPRAINTPLDQFEETFGLFTQSGNQ